MIGSALVWTNSRLGWRALAALCLASLLALVIALLPVGWAVPFTFGAILVVSTLVRPQVGLLLLIPAIPFGSLFQVNLGVMNVGLAEMVVGMMLFAWGMRRIALRPSPVRRPALALPMTIFLVALVFSVPAGNSLEHSVKEIVKWVEVLAVYVVAANELNGRWSRALVVVMLATGAVVALHGIYQFLFQVGPEGFILFDRFMRAYGTFEQPNPYAGYLGLILPVAIGLILTFLFSSEARASGRWVALAAGAGALMLVALAMSWSRGAWLGFVAALIVMVFAVAVRSERAAVLSTVLVALAAYALLAGGTSRLPIVLVERFRDFAPFMPVKDLVGTEITDANFAVLERAAHWQSAVAMWSDHPWSGVGIGNYEPNYVDYALPQWPDALGHAHNYYLNIAAETGLLGLAAYLSLWGAAIVSVWRTQARAKGWWWGVTLGALGMLVHLSVHNLSDNLYVHAMYLHVALLLGVVAAYEQAQRLD